MKFRRVVITGMGVISSAGTDLSSFSESISTGKRSLSPINDKRISHFNARFAGLVNKDISNNQAIDTPDLKFADRFVKLAAIAANQAIDNAGAAALLKSVNAGLILGTCSGPMLTIEEQYQRELDGNTDLTPEDFFKRQYYSASVLLAKRFGIRGPVLTVTTACSAFIAALTVASDFIRLGLLDIALVGGADSFSTTTLAGFAGLKATHDSCCSPFSIPPGLNLGEGSGFVVLERKESAHLHCKPVDGELLGYGLSNDAWHCSAPDPTGKGAAQSMQKAIEDSGVPIEDITYISAHGTGTAANDKAETKAIRRVFGQRADSVPVSSIKGAVGHCLGAAGAVETIATLTCAKNGVYPSSIGFTEPREGCNLDYIPDSSRVWKQGTVFLKNNFAFGGNNASVIIATKDIVDRNLPDQSDDPICISGFGVVSAAGIGAENLISESRQAHSKINISGRGCFDCQQVPSFDLQSIDKRLDPRMERSAQLATIAVIKALASAGIPERQTARLNLGLFMSIAQGSTWAETEHIISLLNKNYELNQVNAFPFIVPNSVTGTVCRVMSLTGHNNTFCNGHGAGLVGLGLAWAAIRNGHVPMLLSGSVDDLSERGLVDCIRSEHSTGQNVLGEGAAMFLLEKYSHVKERGAVPLCYIRSFAFLFSDGLNQFESYCTIIEKGLTEARIVRESVGAVCYNTWCNDAKRAVKTIFGNDGYHTVDCSKVTGYAPASLPLFNISAVLNTTSLEFNENKKYILTFFNASYATNCVAIFEKIS